MTKVLISQPWANMICVGLVDVFDLGIDLGTKPCRVLIHAAPWQKYDNRPTIPLEWRHALEMAQLLGIVPLYHELQYDCLIGFVTAEKVTPEPRQVWAYGGNPKTVYRLSNPFIFDDPLAKGTDVTEEHLLRASEPFPCAPFMFDGHLVIPVNHKIFEEATEGYTVNVPLTDAMARLLTCNGKNIPFAGILLGHGNFVKRFLYEKDNDFHIARDEKGKPKHVFSIVKNMDVAKPFFTFNLKHKVY